MSVVHSSCRWRTYSTGVHRVWPGEWYTVLQRSPDCVRGWRQANRWENYDFVVVLPSVSGCKVLCFLVTLFNRSILWRSTSTSGSYWWFPQYHSAVCVWCKQHRCRICHPIPWCWQGLPFWWVESVRLVSLVVVHPTLKSLQYKVPWKWHKNACGNLKIQACLVTVQWQCRMSCAAV